MATTKHKSTAIDEWEGSEHYKGSEIEPLDFIQANNLEFCAGNVVKYVSRHRRSGSGRQDLIKAIHYIKRIIEKEYPEPKYATKEDDVPMWWRHPETGMCHMMKATSKSFNGDEHLWCGAMKGYRGEVSTRDYFEDKYNPIHVCGDCINAQARGSSRVSKDEP